MFTKQKTYFFKERVKRNPGIYRRGFLIFILSCIRFADITSKRMFLIELLRGILFQQTP